MADKLDLIGLKCPLVVLKIRRAMDAVAPGGMLAVIADDPLALLDVPVMCHHARFALVEARKDAESRIHFRIEKPPGWVKPAKPGPIK
jgi:tRNA 2-thiouridine synthesizing protein A